MSADLLGIPPERDLPPERFAAVRNQLESVVTKRHNPFVGRWRLGAVLGLGVGLTVGGGVALAAGVFSHPLPGSPRQTPLAHTITATHTGTATVELGQPPHRANSVSITLTGLSVGTYRFPNGSSMGCDKSDLASRPYGCRSTAVEPLAAGQDSITITAAPGVTWRLQATYVKEMVAPWKTNALGETYGVPNGKGFPDLVAVSFDQGRKSGYASGATSIATGTDPALLRPPRPTGHQRSRHRPVSPFPFTRAMERPGLGVLSLENRRPDLVRCRCQR